LFHLKKVFVFLVLIIIASQCGCSRDYVTGKPTFTLIGEDDEVALGQEQDKLVIAEYGLYDDDELAAYIERIGQSLAGNSQRAHLKYYYRVLDTEMINAFALPGGYVYMPRGILAYFNSEDQLAGVMGHETGHIVARHSVEQMSNRVLLSGFGLTDVLSKAFPTVGGLVAAPINLGLLKYSRGQEEEADRLGVEYVTRTGHNGHELAEFFKLLGELSSQSGRSVPTYLSSHPEPGDRYTNVNNLTIEWQTKITYQPLNKDPGEYLKRIDGLVYGPNPRKGFFMDGMFYHPQLKFQFPVPAKWEVANSASRVMVADPDQKALLLLTIADAKSTQEVADKFTSVPEVNQIRREQRSVNGYPATVVESAAGKGSKGTHILSYFIDSGGPILAFHGLCVEESYPAYAGILLGVLDNVAPLRDEQILQVQPWRIRIKPAPSDGDLRSVLLALGVRQDQLQEIANINGRSLEQRVVKGDWIKVVGK
jgi:predicted Zn-dependent protease